MTSKNLHKYFSGDASDQEILCIKEWAESSEENMTFFKQERVLYDILLIHGDNTSSISNKPTKPILNKRIKFFKWGLSAACIALIILVSAGASRHIIYKNLNTAIQTINVPTGQYINMQLPDGSNVWINAQTTIKYPAIFTQNKRSVYIDGEAYFQVARDESHPFEVETSKGVIRVLGTEFNVKSYSKDNKFSAALLSGEIEIGLKGSNEMLHMTANTSATLDSGKLKITPIESYNPYTWKDGLLTFSNVGFEEMMMDFEKTYGIDIIIDNKEVMRHKYTGKFRITEGLDYALSVLQKSISFEFINDTELNKIHIR